MNFLNGIEAVTFDVGGTLIEPWPSVGDIYAKVAAENGIQVKPEILNHLFAAAWKAKKNFEHSKSDWSNLVDATFANLVKTPPSQTFFPKLFDAFAKADAWRIYEDVLPTLERLSERGLKLAAISNWDERLRPLLHELKLDSFFTGIFVSIDLAPKPSRKIFEAAAEMLEVTPGKILHVGDSRVEDFHGAGEAGFRALWLRRNLPVAAPEQILRLSELISD